MKKTIIAIFVLLSVLILYVMLYKYFIGEDTFISIKTFLDNLPPFDFLTRFNRSINDMHNLILDIETLFSDGFEFSDILDAFVIYFQFLSTFLKLLVVDLVSTLIDFVFWIYQVLQLLFNPEPILTPFDKGVIV